MNARDRRLAVWALACALLCPAVGCGESAGTKGGDSARGPISAAEAARVNGASIGVVEVAQVARALNVEPRVALDRLVGEQLLVEEAERRGLDKAESVAWIARQAAVQTLLEREIETIPVSEEAVSERYEAQRDRFSKPERRKSLHVLVSMGRDVSEARATAGRSLAAGILSECLAAPDPKPVWERYRSIRELDGFSIKAEDVPAAARTDGFAPEYLDGLFSLAAPGLVPAPVRTDFGWHAILVTGIEPAEITPLTQARDTVRKELLEATRATALDALVAKLTRTHRVERNEQAVDALLHADSEALGITAP